MATTPLPAQSNYADPVLRDAWDNVNHAIRVTSDPSAAGPSGQGSKAIASAGTPLQLTATPTPCTGVYITARIGNTKEVAVGFSNTVRATAGAEVGLCLQPGNSVYIPVADVSKIWVDAQVNTEGVSYSYN